jgi:NADH:ubiquinone oxidoreductase subunit E
MYRREPGGKTTIRMCTNISCMLRRGYEVLDAFEKTLGIKKNEVTKDGQFHLVEEECIAACANAPCAVVGTKYILDITPDQVPQIVEELRRNPKPEGEVV